MSKRGRMLLAAVACVQIVAVASRADHPQAIARADDASPTPTIAVPTVSVSRATPVDVPTVTIPQPTTTPTPVPPHKRHAKKRRAAHVKPTPTPTPTPRQTWIWAYLTSYCPGSAGWVSSSGLSVFYGMLANNFYTFGTRVYLPVLGITGVVEDREADGSWNHFDVWSPSCYSTPTGYFKVAVLG